MKGGEKMNAESPSYSRFDVRAERTMTPAELTFSTISTLIKDFERHTPNDRLVCAMFPAYPNTPLIIKSVGFTNPDLILFEVLTKTSVCSLVVLDISQLNLALTTVPVQESLPPRRPIGFAITSQERQSPE